MLFERLVDDNPRSQVEYRPLRTHDAPGLRASVLRRLELLLNTRSPRPRPESGTLTVLDFGLPDISALYTHDAIVHARLATEIRRTVEAFEPRLIVDDVAVGMAPGNERSVRVAIQGRLRSEETTEPVAFTIALTGDRSVEGTSSES